jgi:hypothetical protein
MKPILMAGGQGKVEHGSESMKTSLLSARQIMLALSPITAISVARQSREESQRNGRHCA